MRFGILLFPNSARRHLHENKYSYIWFVGRGWNIKCYFSVDAATLARHVFGLTALERAYNTDTLGKNARKLPVTAAF